MKPGLVYGETDDFGYFVTRDKMTVRDLHATVLHALGLAPPGGVSMHGTRRLSRAMRGKRSRSTPAGSGSLTSLANARDAGHR